MEHLTEFVFISMGNLTLACRDTYLTHMKSGVKLDTLDGLRTAPIHITTLFPDSVIKKAEEEIAHFESKGQSSGARVGTTHMKGRKGKQTGSCLSIVISHLGRTSARLNTRGVVERQHTTRDQPRASSPINDNYCSHRSPGGLLAGSQTSTQELFSDIHVNFHVVLPVPTVPRHSQKRELSPGSTVCHVPTDCKLKYVKGVSCVT